MEVGQGCARRTPSQSQPRLEEDPRDVGPKPGGGKRDVEFHKDSEFCAAEIKASYGDKWNSADANKEKELTEYLEERARASRSKLGIMSWARCGRARPDEDCKDKASRASKDGGYLQMGTL